MTTISTALSELNVTEWVLRGEPTTEAEFGTMFAKVTGADANGTAIESSDHRLIATTDWWAGSDRTMTAEQTAYRQALRDITASATSLDDVTWPTKP